MQQPAQQHQGLEKQENIQLVTSVKILNSKQQDEESLLIKAWFLLNQQEDEDNENNHTEYNMDSV
jgi:hypothetical protein